MGMIASIVVSLWEVCFGVWERLVVVNMLFGLLSALGGGCLPV